MLHDEYKWLLFVFLVERIMFVIFCGTGCENYKITCFKTQPDISWYDVMNYNEDLEYQASSKNIVRVGT